MTFSPSYLWAIAASLTWGLSYALDEKILSTNAPVHLAIINALISLIILIPLAIVGDHGSFSEFVHGKHFGLMIFSSVLITLAGLFILYGVKELGASTASMIEISYPFFVVLFTALLWGERLSPSFAIGGALMFIGSLIVIHGRG